MTLAMSDSEYISALDRLGRDVVLLQIEARRRDQHAFAALCAELGTQSYRQQVEAGMDPRNTPLPRYRGSVGAGKPWGQE
ncbi:MAG: hypothetical protein MJH10_10170 [Epibacterium sp.]|nr:hypothetical protein [Epibacterium sp.]NQX73903.1 hypothetical protein [Epibacterium sp.]